MPDSNKCYVKTNQPARREGMAVAEGCGLGISKKVALGIP